MLLPLLAMSEVMADNDPIKYFERSWDAQNKKVVSVEKTCTDYTLISGDHSGEWLGLENGWYVVKDHGVKYQTLNILGNAHIILCDGAYLSLTGGVKLEGERTLTVYGQTENSGVLSGYNDDYDNTAGIGSAEDTTCGDLVIHGGTVYAQGNDAAGIGGGYGAHSGSFVMYDGDVYTTGGDGGAGIGGGKEHGIGKSVTIYGGRVRAIGGEYGAGIGGGDLGNQSGPVTIYGGEVISSGKFYYYGGDLPYGGGGAGIGGGDEGSGGFVHIYGGTVRAYSRGFGAGIGGGQNRGIIGEVNIMGGDVEACGYELSISFSQSSGAGIGGGQGGSQGGTIRITGGKVKAIGGKEAAGIGGGAYSAGGGEGGTVIITGGTVQATSGSECEPSQGNGGCAIGSGKYVDKTSSKAGTLTVGATMMMSASESEWNLAKVEFSNQDHSRRWSKSVKIEPCDHSGEVEFTINDGFTHKFDGCVYCNGTNEEHIFGSNGKCRCGLLALNDHASNVSLIETWNGQTQPVTLSGRTLYKDGTWNTLCLPFSFNTNYTILRNATVKTLISSSYDSSTRTLTLNFSEYNVNTIKAGWPYIVKWEGSYVGENFNNPVFYDATLSTSDNGDRNTDCVTFKGITSPMEIQGENKGILYLGSDSKLCYPSDNMTLGSCRAYFQLEDGLINLDLGDVNGDGQISVTDVMMLVDHILGNDKDNFIEENADVNGDKIISVTDVMLLVKIVLQDNQNAINIVVNGADGITYGGSGTGPARAGESNLWDDEEDDSNWDNL